MKKEWMELERLWQPPLNSKALGFLCQAPGSSFVVPSAAPRAASRAELGTATGKTKGEHGVGGEE